MNKVRLECQEKKDSEVDIRYNLGLTIRQEVRIFLIQL